MPKDSQPRIMSEISKLNQNLIIRKIDNKTINIQVIDNEILISIVGQFDQNLKHLSKLTSTNVFFRGNSITCKGNSQNTSVFCKAIKFLINKYLLTNIIEKEDILLSVKKNEEFKESNIKSFKQLIKTPRKSVIARSERQSDYIKALKENDIVIAMGPAGTGKSFLAVSVAVTLLMEKKIERVILSRPAVEAGEKLGFLPGDMKEKVDPYLRPLYDALYELFGADKIDKKIETGEIEIAPLAFMRGRTLKNCFAILDEAQNATETQIKMFLTRIGENSKLVVNGDPSQVDLINKTHSGLIKSKNILKKLDEIKIIEFDYNDVVRHPLVSKIIRAYQSKSTDDQN
jgi:phosphate starvation-inducible protein PhoH and related proteins